MTTATTTTAYAVEDGAVRGRDGDIRVRDYRLDGGRASPPFLWVHGGGFVLGGLDQKESDAPARRLAATGRWVRTLDYRLAPNMGLFRQPTLGPAPGRFPAAHHDVIDVAAAMRTEGGAPIDIGGASAGANLAAGAVLASATAGSSRPAPSSSRTARSTAGSPRTRRSSRACAGRSSDGSSTRR